MATEATLEVFCSICCEINGGTLSQSGCQPHSMEEHAGAEHVIGIYGPGGEPDVGSFIRLV